MEDINWKMFVAPIIILFVFIGGIIGIVNWQKSKQEQAPVVNDLTVNLPEGEVQSGQKEITVNGSVSEGNQVFINGDEVQVNKEGSYTKTVVLDEGENKIEIQTRRDGEVVKTVERTVRYTAASPASEVVSTPSQGQPATSPSQAPVSPAPSSLATSGPEEVIIPIVGFGGVIVAVAYYARSKKQLTLNLRK